MIEAAFMEIGNPFYAVFKDSTRLYTGIDPDTGKPLSSGEMALAAAGLIPGVATGKNIIKAGKTVHTISKTSKAGKDVNKVTPLLPSEGKVGTFKELSKQGSAFDNITPHHMPSAAKMKQARINRNKGVSMNMEQPHPGVGGRHRKTYTYGLNGNKLEDYLNLSYRDALTHDILDARRIYMKDGLYTPEIRKGLQNTIEENKRLYPELFNK